MKKSLTGNYVDVLNRQMFYARITFSKTIVDIEVLDANIQEGEPFIMPGFIDSHVHIESSMLTPQRFATMVLPHGTVGVVCDPHEIANVLGEEGVDYMMKDAKKSPLNFFFAIPSCVPSTPFETNGADFGVKEIQHLMPKGVALAEMMNYPGVINNDADVLKKIEIAHSQGRPVDGHIPGVRGESLAKYVAAGISTDHESYELSEALEKINLGMKILIREGSAARNLDALKSLMMTHTDSVMACTDDAHPDDIRARGHIDKFYHCAMKMGIPIYDIYRVLLLNPIEHYKLRVGRLQLGDRADFIVVRDIEKLDIESVYIGGTEVARDGAVLYKPRHSKRINRFIDRDFSLDDFKKISKGKDDTQHVIGLIPDQILTEHILWRPNLEEGAEIESSLDDDIVKIAVVNRYKEAPVVCGFIKGTGLKKGAMASSIAHDSHNVVIIGRDAESMLLAAKKMFEMKGGIVVVYSKSKVSKLRLPIAGLMVGRDWEHVANKYEKLVTLAQNRLQTSLKSPFMTMAFMSLQVIPSLKIGDMGLFDVDKFELIKE